MKLLIDALLQMNADLNNGALLTIDANRTRLRILPFAYNEPQPPENTYLWSYDLPQ